MAASQQLLRTVICPLIGDNIQALINNAVGVALGGIVLLTDGCSEYVNNQGIATFRNSMVRIDMLVTAAVDAQIIAALPNLQAQLGFPIYTWVQTITYGF